MDKPMRLGEIMAEYLEELEATCAAYRERTTRGVAPF